MRLGEQYQQALPLLDYGFNQLRGALDAHFQRQQKEKDQERIRQALTAYEQTAPQAGSATVNVPAMPTEAPGWKPDEQTGMMMRTGFTRPGQEQQATVPLYNPEAVTTKHRQITNVAELDPATIVELLTMESGEGSKQLGAMQNARAMQQPRVDEKRFKEISKGASLYDLLTGKTVASNTDPADTKVDVERLPLHLQQAYKLVNDLDADVRDRRMAAELLKRETGQDFTVGRKTWKPDEPKQPSIHGANGALYRIGASGQSELIVPADQEYQITRQLDTYQRMYDGGGLDDGTYKALTVPLIQRLRALQLQKQPAPGAAGPAPQLPTWNMTQPNNAGEFDYVPGHGVIPRQGPQQQ